MINGLVGKTVSLVEYVNESINGYGNRDVLTLHFTDGSMITVCESVPDIEWNGLDVCASVNEEV